MKIHRINNPRTVDRAAIAARVATGHRVIVQFSDSCYTPELLAGFNECVRELADVFEIRFYSHRVDARVLRHVSDVQRLSIDCTREAEHLDALALLTDLRHLRLGVYDTDHRDILSLPSLRGIESLSLGENRVADVDLEPLRGFDRLHDLHLTGQAIGLAVLTAMKALTRLSLSCLGKQVGLSFISRITGLTHLRLMLGGRDSIEEIDHAGLRELELVRIRGLARLGRLERFRELRKLLIEDQIRIPAIDFVNSPRLECLGISNCKTLAAVTGLDTLVALKHLGISRTGLDLEALLASPLPPALESLVLYTGKAKRDAAIRKAIAAKGYAHLSSVRGA